MLNNPCGSDTGFNRANQDTAKPSNSRQHTTRLRLVSLQNINNHKTQSPRRQHCTDAT
ncbi:conserved hypothetical protein [Ricinus communis]|uniref:Uncharacterized protein n=1 Tax=Ricinus communis TaxID=3988 RepID=B9SAJ4_RICCO|nr:conserved hypothetical protein [Ricinus communis]